MNSLFFDDDEMGVRRRAVTKARPQWAYPINEYAFQAPLSPIAQYWAGFLMADGSVGDDNTLRLNLQERDYLHIEKLRRFLHAEHPVYYRHATRSVGIKVCSARLAGDLADLGITPRKSLVCRVDESVSDGPDFWRGMIDGDGHIEGGRTGRSLSLVGGLLMLQQWQNFAVQFGARPTLIRGRGMLFIARSGAADTRELLTLLYASAPRNAWLNRKYDIAMEMLRKWRP